MPENEDTVIGQVGVLTIASRGAGGPGEVMVRLRGGSETYLAWSESPLPVGASVLIVDTRGARTLGVVPLDRSLDPHPQET